MVNQQIGPGMVIQQQQEVPSKDLCDPHTPAYLHTEIERGTVRVRIKTGSCFFDFA